MPNAVNDAEREREIYSFPKNSTEVVKAVIAEFKGHVYVSLRVWWTPNGADEAKPTKKGLTLSVECFDELERAVVELRKALKAQGLVEQSPRQRARARSDA